MVGTFDSIQSQRTMKDEQKQGCQRFLALLFLTAVDKTKYSTVINNTNQQLFPQGAKQVLHWYFWHGSHVGDPLWQTTKKQDAMHDGVKIYNIHQSSKPNTRCNLCNRKGHAADQYHQHKMNPEASSDSERSNGAKSGNNLGKNKQKKQLATFYNVVTAQALHLGHVGIHAQSTFRWRLNKYVGHYRWPPSL